MSGYYFIDNKGTFLLDDPSETGYLYFPLVNEAGMKSSITPLLGGDNKTGQNAFLMPPVSSEDIHNSHMTRNFWLRIEGKNIGVWSATGVSAMQISNRTTNKKECCSMLAGPMWQKVRRYSSQLDIESEILSFVPACKENIEIMKVTIRNTGVSKITVTPIAAIPMYCRSADNIRDHRHVTSLLNRTETDDYGVKVKPTLTFDERGHRKNELTYFVCASNERGGKPAGFYPTACDFTGEAGCYEWPDAVTLNLQPEPSGKEYAGYDAMGGIRFKEVTLEAGKKADYIVIMGISEKEVNTKNIIKKYGTVKQVEDIFNETTEYWSKMVTATVHTGDNYFNNYMYWVGLQPTLRRYFGCSFLPHHDYGKGGRGWRDLWQDCLALILMDPTDVREMLKCNFGGVRIDGTNATIIGQKQGEFIADRNNIVRVWMDHGVWPFMTTELYIQMTGDFELLEEQMTYFKDKQVYRGEEFDDLWTESDGVCQRTESGETYRGTVLEHLLLQNITSVYDAGEHNYIRLRGADWNDAVDMAKERGESVAFTFAYAGNLSSMAKLIRQYEQATGNKTISLSEEIAMLLNDDLSVLEDISAKKKLLENYYSDTKHFVSGKKIDLECEKIAGVLQKISEWMMEFLRNTQWLSKEGFYNGYYDNHGRQVEGTFDKSVRMMLTGQVFAIMSGTATEKQISSITKAADKYLYNEKIGGYKLNTDFGEVKDDLGRMFGFAYGHKENGAVFSHMAVMYANSLYKRGFIKAGYKAVKSLWKQSENFEVSRIYPGIPEYFSDRGRGMYHYLTGSASWLLLTVVNEMFGAKGDGGNLMLEPKLMAEQFDSSGIASIDFEFGGRKLKISYENPQKLEFGKYRIEKIIVNNITMDVKKPGLPAIIDKDVLAGLDKQSRHVIRVTLK